MKKQNILFFVSLLLLGTIFITGCKEDDPDPVADPLTLTSLLIGGIDLDIAVPSVDVPLDAEIVATFSTNVDAATAQTAISLMEGAADVAATITVSCAIVTVTPDADLVSGSSYTFAMSSELASTEGEAYAGLTSDFNT